jgi:2-keto-3-deoxy-L-rhamnonate aldolase RhmA
MTRRAGPTLPFVSSAERAGAAFAASVWRPAGRLSLAEAPGRAAWSWPFAAALAAAAALVLAFAA